MKTVLDVAAWFRTLDPTSAWLFILVFVSVALLRFPEIESAVAAQEPRLWLELVEPVAWATMAVALKVLGVPAVVRLRVALSPTYRFRQLEQRACALAIELSNGGNYSPILLLGVDPQATPHLETMIAAFKADLDVQGVCRTPPIQDIDGWNRAVPGLRALMRVGALSDASSHDWTADS